MTETTTHRGRTFEFTDTRGWKNEWSIYGPPRGQKIGGVSLSAERDDTTGNVEPTFCGYLFDGPSGNYDTFEEALVAVMGDHCDRPENYLATQCMEVKP